MKIFILLIILSIGIFPQESPKKEKENVKLFLGVVGGNPIEVNTTAGIYFNNFGIRISGGAWIYSRYGLQLDLTYIFSSKNSIQHQVSLISAYVSNRKLTSNNFFNFIYRSGPAEYEYINSLYFGATYNFLWKGLFIQLGPAWGTGNFEKPRLIMQLGYVHIFD
ncbi:MAG: hypothetical protein A2315_07740 [Ignavibacteria bacterium RIFOXYB2_FULL_35_12]|nr:MAG: hypothetical protein A2058_01875 [Ignavibacteria bacterium GWA2_36_19]OGU60401.1 MAG: hypothetical protein A2X60_02950 [Ignavibacteria bacterium GWF2_35_20]OGU83157.1 MAG: hypothetical protein A2254_12640 [Ignavibacteria bacterium RIFOXYA2_FULL_35_9]OGU84298.1 MAG: hypothetical protein A3K31_15480 [Ignavibacteria bacterium RIFOXYA12_FULL_35_25]OGU88553.1 MAG: hypothetical protein A2492_03525 [Ignavibacteria bacterium RIFOXYC12_FULL_35_11]OGU95952.1 MAG: hypothetical protein A2347_10060